MKQLIVILHIVLISSCAIVSRNSQPEITPPPLVSLKTSSLDKNDTELIAFITESSQMEIEKRIPFFNRLPEYCTDNIYSKYLYSRHYFGFDQHENITNSPSKSKAVESQYQATVSLLGTPFTSGNSFPVTATPLVASWLDYFQSKVGRRDFMKWLIRSMTYREIVIPLLENEGLPGEILFLAMIESGFSNTAFSKARATGTWQFMKQTALSYDLKIDQWVDERRDPIKSTLAAARYLKDLYSQFDDWYLTLAAYNAGPGKIRSAIKKTGSRDFWVIANSTSISRETKHYVPKMLAAVIISSSPQKYGFSVQKSLYDEIPNTIVEITRPAELAEIADKLGIPDDKLAFWNPELIRGITPPYKKNGAHIPYALRLPKKYVEKFLSIEHSLAHLEIQDVLMHKITKGDTIAKLARVFKVTAKQIKIINPDINPKSLSIGKQIAIPIPAIINKKNQG